MVLHLKAMEWRDVSAYKPSWNSARAAARAPGAPRSGRLPRVRAPRSGAPWRSARRAPLERSRSSVLGSPCPPWSFLCTVVAVAGRLLPAACCKSLKASGCRYSGPRAAGKAAAALAAQSQVEVDARGSMATLGSAQAPAWTHPRKNHLLVGAPWTTWRGGAPRSSNALGVRNPGGYDLVDPVGPRSSNGLAVRNPRPHPPALLGPGPRSSNGLAVRNPRARPARPRQAPAEQQRPCRAQPAASQRSSNSLAVRNPRPSNRAGGAATALPCATRGPHTEQQRPCRAQPVAPTLLPVGPVSPAVSVHPAPAGAARALPCATRRPDCAVRPASVGGEFRRGGRLTERLADFKRSSARTRRVKTS